MKRSLVGAGVVSFHGGLKSSVPESERNLKAKVLVCHGADDPHVSPRNWRLLRTKCANRGPIGN